MLKYVSMLVVLLFLSGAAIAQVVTDCQVERLKGKVKTIVEDSATLEGKPGHWKELRRRRVGTMSWDKQGYEVERIAGAVDQPMYKAVSSYNATQKTRTEHRYDFPIQGGVKGYILDSQGKPIKPPPPTQAPDDVVISEILYTFDDKGNRSGYAIYQRQKNSKKLVRRSALNWNTDGKLKEGQWYDGAGKLLFKFVYKYDAQGNEIEALMIVGQNTSRTTYSEYQFDAQGNWISRISQEDSVSAYNPNSKTTYKTYRQITYWQ
ncbi:MAG: hypothetical protein JNM09_25870 [Blastocatellia bacterium]|nr:hypothetical protein [Blastocatellia bacterium]